MSDIVIKKVGDATTIIGFDPVEHDRPIDITYGDMDPVSVRISYTMEETADLITALTEALEYCQELQQETEQAAAHAERPA